MIDEAAVKAQPAAFNHGATPLTTGMIRFEYKPFTIRASPRKSLYHHTSGTRTALFSPTPYCRVFVPKFVLMPKDQPPVQQSFFTGIPTMQVA
jgi:hypothetical protein